jgi:hypothetical protein
VHSSVMSLKIFGGEIWKDLINILEEFEVGLKLGAYRFWMSCDRQTPLFSKRKSRQDELCLTRPDSISRKEIQNCGELSFHNREISFG